MLINESGRDGGEGIEENRTDDKALDVQQYSRGDDPSSNGDALTARRIFIRKYSTISVK